MSLNTNLTHYYKFDNSLTDEVGSDDFTNNGATYTASGKLSGCYSFDGTNDYMTAGTSSGMINACAFTISVWVLKDAYDTDSDRVLTVHKGDPSSGCTLYYYDDAGQPPELKWFINDGTNSDTVVWEPTPAGPLDTTNFHHAVLTYDGTTYRLYVNGTERDTTTVPGTVSFSTRAFTLGSYDGSGSFHNGDIDELGIWSRALSASEVSQLYNSGDGLSYPFSDGFNMQINIGDTWKDVEAIKINIGDTWKDVDAVKINIGDTWKDV